MEALGPGTKLGSYELLTPIDAGMGEVWKARDKRLDRIVAIKFSQAHFSDRFEREALVIAALNYPKIAHVYDVGPDYLVMEYRGRTCARVWQYSHSDREAAVMCITWY